MAKIYLTLFVCLFIFLSFPNSSFAQSTYVLPYPSYMPGNFLYKPRLVINKISEFIYFGDFGKFDYNLKESDHYLVEAKILFDYNQYLLAAEALKKSDAYFQKINPNLENARKNNKNISERKYILREASSKHIETLKQIKDYAPETINWSPEDSKPTLLNLSELIDYSLEVRSSVL